MSQILRIKKNKLNPFSIKEIEKAYTEGIYSDSPANRKLGRVGMTYKDWEKKAKNAGGGDEGSKGNNEKNDDIDFKGKIPIDISENVKLSSSQKKALADIQSDFAKNMKERELSELLPYLSMSLKIDKGGAHLDLTSEQDWNGVYREAYGESPDEGYGGNPMDTATELEEKYNKLLESTFKKSKEKTKFKKWLPQGVTEERDHTKDKLRFRIERVWGDTLTIRDNRNNATTNRVPDTAAMRKAIEADSPLVLAYAKSLHNRAANTKAPDKEVESLPDILEEEIERQFGEKRDDSKKRNPFTMDLSKIRSRYYEDEGEPLTTRVKDGNYEFYYKDSPYNRALNRVDMSREDWGKRMDEEGVFRGDL